ncbi:BLUF domain-containing protein [Pontivivens ytuae]|uniref:BLUF domain-containing protein n=1 Tax=Pontivivens ytuae TaxID=2789856 RepID=A0A7S9QBY4_9RHOB|nr:BLUF domain-containing protein [Pontivivens ytuae]QPH52506.1 BLUF domain-containing protein [Pontivivens ytuae]
MPGPIYSLIYRSFARPPWIEGQVLNDISVEANAFNSKHHITGMLIFSDGVFVQVLEGSTVEVLSLSARIAADPRNERLRVLWHGNVGERRFPEWSMGCFDFSDVPDRQAPLDPGVLDNEQVEPVWTDTMTQRLIDFYRENRVEGLGPVFAQMRRLP